MKNIQSQIFFNIHTKIKSSTAILIPRHGDNAFFGVLHTPLDGSESLLTKAMKIDQIDINEKFNINDLENSNEFENTNSLYSYKNIKPFFVNLNDYEIIFSQNKMNDFLEKHGAKKDYNSDNKNNQYNLNNPNVDFLKDLKKNKLILIEPSEGKIFYLGYTLNPMRDFKQGSNYLTLDNVLLISKKPSPLEGRCNEWKGFDFYDNGITFNTMSKFSVPINRTSSFYTDQKIVKRFEKELKKYKPLEPVKNALDYIVMQS